VAKTSEATLERAVERQRAIQDEIARADKAKKKEKAPMKRPAQPEEIAPAYVFLASPHCSSYITGEILPIIGGY
jgi:NAD(P)-dependent dehydrogenase (short-subunit alcohol dehydrogenase family)